MRTDALIIILSSLLCKTLLIGGLGLDAQLSSFTDQGRCSKLPARSKGFTSVLKLRGDFGSIMRCETNVHEQNISENIGGISKLVELRGGSLNLMSSVPIGRLSLQSFKLILQIILTTFNVLCWLIPLKQKGFSQNSKALSIASCFSGGVFLALSMSHLLPESAERAAEIGLPQKSSYLACLFGYFLILFVEKVAFDSHALLHDVVEGSHSHAHVSNKGRTLSTKSAVVLLVAMSLHSLIETVALGIAKEKASAAMMAASIGLHQPAETLALLVAFLKTSLTTNTIVKYLLCFSIVGPLGVTIGLIINQLASNTIDALIVAVTAGTFIYMGATEIANEEFEDASNSEKFARYGAMLSGVASIYALTSKAEQLEHFAGGH